MKNFSTQEFRLKGDDELIKGLGLSNRFKNMVVTDYQSITDVDEEKQFGAITIHISKEELFISFIGTDSTLNGWKEDFNMAFMNDLPCQKAGKEYTKLIAEKYPNSKIKIGGHSKGGNVSIYSANTSDKEIQDRIIKVDNYDGPGFNAEIIEKYYNEDLINKIETYIPQDSVIGRLLEHKEKTTIVLSIEKGMLQHDIYSWEVLRDDLIKLEKNTDSSEVIDKTLRDWLENTTKRQRMIFVDTIFELFYSTEANTFKAIRGDLSTSIPKILKKYSELSESDKDTMTEMIKLMAKCYLNIVKDRQAIKFNNMRKDYIEKSKRKIAALEEKYLSRFKNNKTN